jgi:hypothetical protein
MVYDLIKRYSSLVPSFLCYGTNGLESNAFKVGADVIKPVRSLLHSEPIPERVQPSTVTSLRTTRLEPLENSFVLRPDLTLQEASET